MADIFDQLAAQTAPEGANPTSGSAGLTPPPPATAPASPAGAAPRTAAPAGGDLFDALAKNPALAEPPPVREPGSFGPYDKNSEGQLFSSPVHKGVHEGIAIGLGLKSPNERIGDALADVWDNLVTGAQNSYQRVHKALGGEGETGVAGAVGTGLDVALTPLEMIAGGIEGSASLFEKGAKEMWDARRALAQGTRTAELDQQFGRGAGMILSALGQLAMGGEGEKVGREVGERAGSAMATRAAGPGNALLRAKKANFMFGKNPGAIFTDEPFKVPWAVTRLGQLENLRGQAAAFGERLHAQVNALLGRADTVQTITPEGRIVTAPNLLDVASEVEDAADEVKRDLQKQGGVKNRAAVVKAINDTRDDMLHESDLEGNRGAPKPREMTPTQANEFKKSIGGRPNWKLITDPDAAETAAAVDRFVKKTYGKVNDLVDDSVGGRIGERVRDFNRRYANLIEGRNLLDEEIAREKGTGGMNAMRRKLEWGGAAGGLASGHPVLQFLGALEAINRLGRSVPGRVIAAKAMAAAPGTLAGAGSAAGIAAGQTPAVSGAARRVLAGEEAGGEAAQ